MRTLSLLLRLFLFLLTFALEVRVKAAEIVQLPNAEQILEQPEGCLAQAGLCAIATDHGEKYKLELGGSLVQLDQSTSVVRVSKSEIRLIAGTIWVRAKGDLVVRSEYGLVRVRDTEAWVSHDKDRVTASAVGEPLVLEPRGGADGLQVPSGMENWIGRVGDAGVAETGLPKAIALEPHLQRWARLYTGNRKQFEKDALKFRATWTEASQEAAALHKELYDRTVASISARKAQREAVLRQKQARDRAIRAMFRKRVLDGE